MLAAEFKGEETPIAKEVSFEHRTWLSGVFHLSGYFSLLDSGTAHSLVAAHDKTIALDLWARAPLRAWILARESHYFFSPCFPETDCVQLSLHADSK